MSRDSTVFVRIKRYIKLILELITALAAIVAAVAAVAAIALTVAIYIDGKVDTKARQVRLAKIELVESIHEVAFQYENNDLGSIEWRRARLRYNNSALRYLILTKDAKVLKLFQSKEYLLVEDDDLLKNLSGLRMAINSDQYHYLQDGKSYGVNGSWWRVAENLNIPGYSKSKVGVEAHVNQADFDVLEGFYGIANQALDDDAQVGLGGMLMGK